MSTVELRIRTGARVECTDGYVGTVCRVDTDDIGNLEHLHVATDRGEVSAPEHSIVDVRRDGTVILGCTRAQLGDPRAFAAADTGPMSETISLREERLVARREMRQAGEIVVRTEVEQVPGHLEVDALREEVEVEHVPIGQAVSERGEPWEEDGVLVIPIYEEQLVVSKRLVLREQLRVRRVRLTERQLFEEALQRERVVVEDPANTGMVRERYPTDAPAVEPPAVDGDTAIANPLLPSPDEIRRATENADPMRPQGGFLDRVVRRTLD